MPIGAKSYNVEMVATNVNKSLERPISFAQLNSKIGEKYQTRKQTKNPEDIQEPKTMRSIPYN